VNAVNTKVSGRSGYHHGDLPRALVDAAIELIEEHGHEALTLRDLARRVGVSHTAPYRHFTDKRDLLAAAAEHGFADLGATTLAEFDAAPSPSEGLVALGCAYVRFAAERPVLFRLMFDPSLDDARATLPAIKEAAFGVLLGAVAAAQQAGELRDGDISEIAITAWSMVHGLAHLVIDRGFQQRLERSVDEWVDTVTRLGLAGLSRR
jgi:AcrR family transcriptional regulator